MRVRRAAACGSNRAIGVRWVLKGSKLKIPATLVPCQWGPLSCAWILARGGLGTHAEPIHISTFLVLFILQPCLCAKHQLSTTR